MVYKHADSWINNKTLLYFLTTSWITLIKLLCFVNGSLCKGATSVYWVYYWPSALMNEELLYFSFDDTFLLFCDYCNSSEFPPLSLNSGAWPNSGAFWSMTFRSTTDIKRGNLCPDVSAISNSHLWTFVHMLVLLTACPQLVTKKGWPIRKTGGW